LRTLALHLQIADDNDHETKTNLEMQMEFLQERKEAAAELTEEEQQQLATVLITEKIEELEQQKEFIAEINPDQQLEVTQALLEDRQAWLEGDAEYQERKWQEQQRQEEAQKEQALQEQETVRRIADEVARSITFWTEQKEAAASTSKAEQAQITSFLMAEHIVSLEQQLQETSVQDEETRESLQQQLDYLNEQMENINDMDHLFMINVLVQEKISALEKMVLE
jgi:hypothetical protein